MRSIKAIAGVIALAATVVSLFAASSASAAAQTVYSNDEGVLAGNYPSLGYEATSTQEFGGRVQLAGTQRKATNLRFVLSSWGCETRPGGVCHTSSGAMFPVDITATVYNVGPGGEVGSQIAQASKVLDIPYRPSANLKRCPGGGWYQGSTASCFNGKAVRKTISFGKATIPSDAIVSLAYNTTHHGYSPIGEAAACYSTAAGCGYDSLNVGLKGDAPTIGTQPDPDSAYWNTSFGGFYCDGGTGGTGTFRLDAGPSCWTGFQPIFQLKAA